MAEEARVVIGANWGDCGKGKIVDHYSGPGALVVRFNGGAQAGHTVVTPQGERHIFSHYGSGTLAGAATLLSHHFVCNPMLWLKEWREIGELQPVLKVDPDCPITTPYDMMINQIVEDSRGEKRHGSVGVGFCETIHRSEGERQYVLRACHGEHRRLVRDTLINIRRDWVPERLWSFGIDAKQCYKHPAWDAMSDAVLEQFVADFDFFAESVTFVNEAAEIERAKRVIFEGAQGLGLDAQWGEFPHVTRSNTGLRNVISLSEAAGIRKLDVTYVTRTYATRHGAGLLKNEHMASDLPEIKDETNVPGPYQGTIRLAPLDLGDLAYGRVAPDLNYARHHTEIKIDASFAVTWGDLRGDIPYTCDTKLYSGDAEHVIKAISKSFIPVSLVGTGPRRDQIREYEEAKPAEAILGDRA